MSYDLFLTFDQSVRKDVFLYFFTKRANYKINDKEIIYANSDTGVYFTYSCEFKKNFLHRELVSTVTMEINYFRPRFFGVEAETEITSLVTAFQPKIEDPQMHGMGTGPYSPEGFMRGWNAGNEFAVKAILSQEQATKIAYLPAAKLRDSWAWNYSRTLRQARIGEAQFIPMVMFFAIDGKTCTGAVWPEGMPAILPRVDMLIVGREGRGTAGDLRQVLCLTPWRVVADLLIEEGFAEHEAGFDLNYGIVPRRILDFVTSLPEADRETMVNLSADGVLDADLVHNARNSLE